MRRRGGPGEPAKPLRRKVAGPKQRKPAGPERGQTPSIAQLQEQIATLTRELSEAREEQIASSEVLRAISNSPGELEPVFQSMLENAIRICEAKFGTVFRYDGELSHRVTSTGTPPKLVEFQRKRGPFRPDAAGEIFPRMFRDKAVVHLADEQASPIPGPAATYAGARSDCGSRCSRTKNWSAPS